MPQGGIDPGETPREAALRELREEVGTADVEILAESETWFSYDLPHWVAKTTWEGQWRGQRQKWFVMLFKGQDADFNLAASNCEFDAWQWVPLEKLPQLAVSFKRQLYRDVVERFEPVLPRCH